MQTLRYGMLVREVIAFIEGQGWTLKRVDGSHGQYVSPDGKHLVTLTINHRSAVAASTVIKKIQQALTGAFIDAVTPKKPKKVPEP